MRRSALLSSLCLLITFSVQAQNSVVNEMPSRATTAINTVVVKEEVVDTFKLFYVRKVALNNYAMPTIKLINTKTKPLSSTKHLDKLPFNYKLDIKLGMERKKAFAQVFVPRYINRNGRVEMLESFDFDVQKVNASQKTAGSRVYAANSALATGTWYKVAIRNQGLFKMDYNFFKNELGINPDNIDPRKIKVYGHGGEMLAEGNAIFRHDDLAENAIEVVGESDGTFNASDYVLFYANGPHSIIKDSVNKRFSHKLNVYNYNAYYFINVQGANGKRITAQNVTAPANQSTSTGNYFSFYNPDSLNLGKSGKRWWSIDYSDLPGKSLSRSFSFATPNAIASEPTYVRTRVCAISSSGTNYFNITANGSALHTFSLLPVEFQYFDPIAEDSDFTATLNNYAASTLNIGVKFTQGNNSALGYLDFIEVNGRRSLIQNKYQRFADWNTVGTGNIVEYEIGNTNANTKVWDVTDPINVVSLPTTDIGSNKKSFKQQADSLHTFISFDGTSTFTPTAVGAVANQNLHASVNKDYVIITHPSFKAAATRLANYHTTKRGYRSLVVTPQEIYNEFSSGSQDVSAIRDYIKMLYDRASTPADIPTGILLFGDASYDYRNLTKDNTNYVPTYETDTSLDKTYSYCTDDFYGFLDDTEDFNDYSIANTVDLGIGRIPCQSATEANGIVDKIIYYDGANSFGPWKNVMLFNADDEDANHHFNDAEQMSKYVTDSLPQYNIYKNYIDAYVQQSTPAGPRTPDAQVAFKNRIFNGTFLVNYNGHGGPLGWCEERILTMDDINGFTNKDKLPLYITATCDFTQFDNPELKSAGEILMLNPDGGAIALMSTTRLVYVPGNGVMNINYFKGGFKKINGKDPTLGDAYRDSKNIQYSNALGIISATNFRKFALIGDPGLPLAFPKHRVVTDSINGTAVAAFTDTLKALGKYTISGHVNDVDGNALNSFNGLVYPTVFDKPKQLTTLGNDPPSIGTAGSYPANFFVQNNTLYNGKASVKDGKFSFTFVVPKDINYTIAEGKISYYANNDTEDGTGFSLPLIGGSSSNPIEDNQGPTIEPFLNDEKFVNGGITKANSLLIAKLFDENGINYTGNSVGHDITAVLDGNAQNSYVLNTFYESDLDDYQRGVVRFPLNDLAEGPHTLIIKAWDVFNNSSEARLDFVVVNDTEGKLAHVYNYPNPFSTRTQFMFEHNMPNENLDIDIKIFSISGSVVKNIKRTINTSGTRYDQIFWDGKDQYGDKLGNGVYLYRLSVKSQNGFSDQKIQKLFILR